MDDSPKEFHFYLNLPALGVRERILDFLTRAEDKFNLITALPCELQLKNSWQKINLYFEMVFPILIEQKCGKYSSLLDWKTVLNLCYVNDYFRKVIERHFVKIFGDIYYLKSIGRQKLGDMISMNPHYGIFVTELLEVESISVFPGSPPIPTNIHLNFNKGGAKFQQEQLNILNLFGDKIWNSFIKLPVNSSLHQLIHLLLECLRKMPNLRLLSIYHVPSFTRARNAAIHDTLHQEMLWLNQQLPDMRFLKSLKLDGESPIFALAIMNSLVEKYQATLQNVILYPVYQADLVDYAHVLQCPKLSCLEITETSEKMRSASLKYFVLIPHSPLTVIHLTTTERDTKTFFFTMITILARHYGNSLEKLKIHVADWYVLEGESESKAANLSLAARVRKLTLPKLIYFQMNGFPLVAAWPYLTVFPALEKLHLGFVKPHEDSIISQNILLEYPKHWVDVEDGNAIWELLPFLYRIKLHFFF